MPSQKIWNSAYTSPTISSSVTNPVPFGIDDMSNAAEGAYSAWPERLYVIDERGRVAYRGGMGPFHYDPKEVRSWLAARYGEVKHEDAKPAASASSKAL
jgi:hypothetical protein